MIIHGFLYDPAFVNQGSLLQSVLKTGGICVPSPLSLSYFVVPEEIVDPRTTRANNLNLTFTTKSRLILDQSQYPSVISDVQAIWTTTEQDNLFAIIDQLCFAYNSNNSPAQIALSLSTWPQYVPNSYVLSTTVTTTTAYVALGPTAIICPDYVTFTFAIGNGTQYQFRIWLNNTLFLAGYPLSTVSLVVPPLPVAQLYTLAIVNGVGGIITTADASSQTSQSALQTAIASGEYTGYLAQNVVFVDTQGNIANLQFNILYKGALPGVIAVRTAIRTFLLNSGVGTPAGWQSKAPALFVTQLFYLLPMWENSTALISSVVYPNVISVTKAQSDATTALFDIQAPFVTANLCLLSAFYNNLTVLGVPDPGNASTRLLLSAEHPTYQDVATTAPAFNYMTPITQAFATLLNQALSVAAGNPSTNVALAAYTPAGDRRSYVAFNAGDVQYYLMTQLTYQVLV